jgi:D-glycero-D-manno-heptose 1,7-bisphosphate phosphatase
VGVRTIGRPAIFLDRDGVLVEEVFYPETGEREAPMRPEDVRLIAGAADGLRRLAAAGFLLVLISNQAAHAKGKVGLRSLWLAHERFQELLTQEGVTLDGVHYSFSHPDGIVPHFSGPSLDRKPSPYQLLVAAARLDSDLARSWMIGDRETDVMCGHAAGTRAVRIMIDRSGEPVSKAEIVAADLAAAVEPILAA